MKTVDLLEFKEITNCCGRSLCNTCDEFALMPDSQLAHVNIVGPYYPNDDSTRIEFKRIDEKVLFCDDVSLSDINQGMIGDCWFLSAIDFSINHPKYRERIHENVSQVDENTIKIKLFDTASQEWKETLVDSTTLVNKNDQFPVTMSVKSSEPSEIWPAMLEKGLAKMCGGYPAIEGGLMSEGMCFLHGGRGYFISSKDIVPKLLSQEITFDNFFGDLKFLYYIGYGIFTAWERDMFSDTKDRGLVDGHAYSILDMKSVDGEWIVKLKNPWGKFEWSGKYSDADDSEQADKVRQSMEHKRGSDGIFLMSAFDLFGRCEGLDIYEPLDKNHFEKFRTRARA
jgi:hypothetical protein